MKITAGKKGRLEKEDCELIVADGSVKLLTADELKKDYKQIAGHRIFMEMLEHSRNCSANALGNCVAGVLVIPDKERLSQPPLRFGFFLDEEQLLLVCDDERLTEVFNEMIPALDPESSEMGMIFFEFLEYLIKDDMAFIETYEKRLAAFEDSMAEDIQDIPEDFDGFISRQRKDLRKLMGYYKLLNEVAHVMNEALLRAEKHQSRQLFVYLENRIGRLYSDVEGIAAYAMQIRDVYTSRVNMRQNQVMQTLTIVTAIFMPLTLLAGWYGMNFSTMPELTYRYGYLVAVVVAVVVVVAEIILFKRKKWF